MTPAEYPDGVPEEVCLLFEQIALEIHSKGWTRYSSDAVLHRIRWHYHIDRGNRSFKANDHWTAPLSRWAMKRRPELKGFFETRVLRGNDDPEL